MQIKIITASTLTALSLILMNSAFCKEYRKLPAPSITSIKNPVLSKGKILEVEGSGFIANLPNAHKAYLSKKIQGKKKKKRIKLKVLESTAKSLHIKIPENIEFNDYELIVKIKTRLTRSKFNKADKKVLIRPEAPKKPNLNYDLIESPEQLDLLVKSTENIDKELLRDGEELKIGLNKLKLYYLEDGFESIRSEAASFYYLPNQKFKDPLLINSEDPIESLAQSIEKQKINVSDITKEEILELNKSYFLVSPNNPRYLEKKTLLSPVLVKELHVKSPEYVLLENRSSQDFNLSDCYLTDSIKERYRFTNKFIAAKNVLKVESNLGLNDSSPDKLSLYCPEERYAANLEGLELDPLLEDGYILINSFKYEDLNEEGFAEGII